MKNNNPQKYRHSKQRNKILDLLQRAENHPTATWLYDRLREEFPNLSPGNVYRNLGILVEQGLINKIDFGSTFDRFDANVNPHYHFICEKCGTIVDLDLPVDNCLNERVNKLTNLKAQHHNIQFYGSCDSCEKQTKKE